MRHAPHPLLALFLALLLTRPFCAGEAPAIDPLAEPVPLDLWGKNLRDAVSIITSRSNIDLRVSTDFIHPREFTSYPFYFKAEKLPLRTSLEWLSRSLDCRYRQDRPNAVLLSGSYDWLAKEDRAVLIESYEPALGQHGKLVDLKEALSEVTKVIALFDSYTLRFEEEDSKLVAVLPAEMKRILKSTLLAMSLPGASLTAPPEMTLAPETTELLSLLRMRVVVRYQGWGLRDILDDLQLQTGLAIGVAPKAMLVRKDQPITLSLGTEATLREAIEGLAKAAGFPGYELSPPGGIFFTSEARQWTLASSREFLWEKVLVRSYDVNPLIEGSSGEAIAHFVRRRISPDTWLDPVTSVIYHPPTRSIIVVAPESVQQLIHAHLYQAIKKKTFTPPAPVETP